MSIIIYTVISSMWTPLKQGGSNLFTIACVFGLVECERVCEERAIKNPHEGDFWCFVFLSLLRSRSYPFHHSDFKTKTFFNGMYQTQPLISLPT